MAVVGVADQYLILMAITLLFTVLALVFHESLVVNLLACISWLISAVAHFATGDQTSALTTSLVWLFFGFAIIFLGITVYNVSKMLDKSPDKDWYKKDEEPF